jgi:hypothetical protein
MRSRSVERAVSGQDEGTPRSVAERAFFSEPLRLWGVAFSVVAVLLLIVVLIALLVGFGYVLVLRGTWSEGADVDPSFDPEATVDEDFREAEADAVPPQVARTKPELAGDPPVPGAQWDEVAGRWIRWDQASNAWVPVERA